jgi:hypothetical protein
MGNVYVADNFSSFIGKWTAANSNATTLVSSGLYYPAAVAVDGSGNVYIADTDNNAIKKWTAANSNVTTLVSSGLNYPGSVAVDVAGNVYISENFQGVSLIKELPRAFVDSTPKMEGTAAGSDVLPVVLPATANLIGPFNPVSDSAWLTISGVTNGVVSFAFAANTAYTNRTANITLLGQTVPVVQNAAVAPPTLTGFTILSNGAFQFGFTNNQGASFSVWATTNLALPLINWTNLGSVTNDGTGHYQFTDQTATNGGQCFYRVTSP